MSEGCHPSRARCSPEQVRLARQGISLTLNRCSPPRPSPRPPKDRPRLRGSEFCEGLPGRVAQGLGGLDILVNNAAYQRSKESILDISDEQFDPDLQDHVYATLRISKAAVPLMKPASVIINTISVNSYNPGE